jgi:hypothetical protein
MPTKRTVLKWLAALPDFVTQYARAREAQADTLAEEILDIANTPQLGVRTETKGEEVKTVEGDMIEHRRLQVDARKWIASKLKPKKYGDRIHQEVTGKDGAPLIPVINVVMKDGSRTQLGDVPEADAGAPVKSD